MNALVCLCTVIVPIVQSSVSELGDPDKSSLEVKYFEDNYRTTYGDVVFSSILFRHADRNEIYYFKTDKNHERFENGDEEMGQLVKRGKQRAYNLGMWTRAYYSKLLNGRKYSPKLLKTVSSKVERTIQSAELFLAGLFLPKDEETWNDTLPWQPVPVYPISPDEDNIIGLVAACPRYTMEVHEFEEKENEEFYKTFDKDFIDYVENKTELKIPRNDAVQAITLLYGVYDNLFVQEQLNLKIPSWATKVYLDRLYQIEKKYFEILVFNEKTKRLKAGPLLKNIVEAMKKKRHKSSTKAFDVYSGHDNTVAVLLKSLGVYDGTPPPYSAALFIELRFKEGNYYVTVLYRTSYEKPPILLNLPDCKHPCTLDEFITATHSLIPSHWKQECNHFDPDYNSILF